MEQTGRRSVIRAIGAGVAGSSVASLAGCVSSDDDPESQSNIEIVDHNPTTSEYGNLTIVGTARNVSGRDLEYVQIEASFYNSMDEKVGDGLANTSGLAEGASWRFDITPMALDTSNFDTYAITGVSSY